MLKNLSVKCALTILFIYHFLFCFSFFLPAAGFEPVTSRLQLCVYFFLRQCYVKVVLTNMCSISLVVRVKIAKKGIFVYIFDYIYVLTQIHTRTASLRYRNVNTQNVKNNYF